MLLCGHGNEKRLPGWGVQTIQTQRLLGNDSTQHAPQPPTLQTMAVSQNLVIIRSKTAFLSVILNLAPNVELLLLTNINHSKVVLTADYDIYFKIKVLFLMTALS